MGIDETSRDLVETGRLENAFLCNVSEDGKEELLWPDNVRADRRAKKMSNDNRIMFGAMLVASTILLGNRVGVTETSEHHLQERQVMVSMSTSHIHEWMAAHMKWTTLHPPTATDQQRAQEIVKTLQATLEKYKDSRVAERDGFRPFHPDFPQSEYHFPNYCIRLRTHQTKSGHIDKGRELEVGNGRRRSIQH